MEPYQIVLRNIVEEIKKGNPDISRLLFLIEELNIELHAQYPGISNENSVKGPTRLKIRDEFKTLINENPNEFELSEQQLAFAYAVSRAIPENSINFNEKMSDALLTLDLEGNDFEGAKLVILGGLHNLSFGNFIFSDFIATSYDKKNNHSVSNNDGDDYDVVLQQHQKVDLDETQTLIIQQHIENLTLKGWLTKIDGFDWIEPNSLPVPKSDAEAQEKLTIIKATCGHMVQDIEHKLTEPNISNEAHEHLIANHTTLFSILNVCNSEALPPIERVVLAQNIVVHSHNTPPTQAETPKFSLRNFFKRLISFFTGNITDEHSYKNASGILSFKRKDSILEVIENKQKPTDNSQAQANDSPHPERSPHEAVH